MSNERPETIDRNAQHPSPSDQGNTPLEPKQAPNKTPLPDKRARRRRIWKGLGLMTLMTGIGGYLYATQTQHGRDTTEVLSQSYSMVRSIQEQPHSIFDNVDSDHVNILLVGRDVNWKIGKVYDPTTKTLRSYQVVDKDAPARSDTMIVVSLDKTRKTMRMVSLPRDARVYIPENKFETGRNKLNAAHAFGGIPLLKQTLHDELGLTIHHHAVIKFEGFKKLIDLVGGVYVDVLGELKRDGTRGNVDYKDKWGGWSVNLKPGKQWLNGEQAHGYVRARMDVEGDPGRIRRQQGVMRALARRLKELPPWRLPAVVKEIRRQFETDMTDEEIASAGFFAKDLGGSEKIQPVTLFGVYGEGKRKGSLILNKPKNELLLKYIFGPTFDSEKFLQRSPWTENDEIEAQGISPATRELLREAGIIKGGRLAASSETRAPDGSLQSTLEGFDSSQSLSVEAPSVEASAAESQAPVERPRRRRETRSRAETRGESRDEASASDAEERPRRRRRVRREKSEAEAPAARRETSSRESVSPLPQPEDASSEAAGEVSSSTKSEDSGGGSSLNVESPIPQPEQ